MYTHRGTAQWNFQPPAPFWRLSGAFQPLVSLLLSLLCCSSNPSIVLNCFVSADLLFVLSTPFISCHLWWEDHMVLVWALVRGGPSSFLSASDFELAILFGILVEMSLKQCQSKCKCRYLFIGIAKAYGIYTSLWFFQHYLRFFSVMFPPLYQLPIY